MPTLDDIASALGDSTNNTTVFAQNNTDKYKVEGLNLNFDRMANTYSDTVESYDVSYFVRFSPYRLTVTPDGVGSQYTNNIFNSELTFNPINMSTPNYPPQSDGNVTWWYPDDASSGGVEVVLDDGIVLLSNTKQKLIKEEIGVSTGSINSDGSSLTWNVLQNSGTGVNWKYYLDGTLVKEYISKPSDPNVDPLSHTFYSGDGYYDGGTFDLKLVVEGDLGNTDEINVTYDDAQDGGGDGGGSGLNITGMSAAKVNNTTYSCSVGVEGGTTPYSYQWSSGRGTFDNPNSSITEINYDYEPPSTETVTVTITDDNGDSVSQQKQIGS